MTLGRQAECKGAFRILSAGCKAHQVIQWIQWPSVAFAVKLFGIRTCLVPWRSTSEVPSLKREPAECMKLKLPGIRIKSSMSSIACTELRQCWSQAVFRQFRGSIYHIPSIISDCGTCCVEPSHSNRNSRLHWTPTKVKMCHSAWLHHAMLLHALESSDSKWAAVFSLVVVDKYVFLCNLL